MLISDMVKVKCERTNKNHIESFGKKYYYKYREEILMCVEDLSQCSTTSVWVLCDYCGEIDKLSYCKYSKRKKGIINKDSCKNCKNIKQQDINLKKYGVKFHNQRERFYDDKVSKRIKYLDFKTQVESHGVKLLTTEKEYNQTNIKNVDIICNIHSESGVLSKNIYEARKFPCRECGQDRAANSHRLTLNQVKEIFQSKGLILLEKEYQNSQTNMKCVCKIHNNQLMEKSLQLVKHSEFSCPICHINGKSKLKMDYEVCKAHMLKHNYILEMSEEEYYIEKGKKILMSCLIHSNLGIMEKDAYSARLGKGCPGCKSDKIVSKRIMPFDEVNERFLKMDYILLDTNYKNSFQKLNFICKKHDNIIQKTTMQLLRRNNHSCKFCQKDNMGRENSPSWKGGITPLYNAVRNGMLPWKISSRDMYGRCCIITGSKKDVIIHHVHKNFSEILYETLNLLFIPIYDNIGRYNDSEMENIIDMCVYLHYKYGEGIPLHKDIHKKFHNIYTQQNNTSSQFEEFAIRYYAGEFDSELNQPELK